MSIPETHFIVDPQPQQRKQLHNQISQDPQWQPILEDQSGSQELDNLFGNAIAELHNSLAVLTVLNPQAKLLGKYAVHCHPYEAEPAIQFMIMSTTALQLGGLDPENVRVTQERLAESLEEKPILFNIVDPTANDDDGSERSMARVDFDGTNYTLTRWGVPFDYSYGVNKTIKAEAWDHWKVWDYNAEKRRQNIAERDGVVGRANHLLANIKTSADSAGIAKVLCTLGLLRDEHFIISPRHTGNNNTNKSDEDLLAFRTSPDGQRLMYSYNETAAERTAAAYVPLQTLTKDITDKTQLAYLRYWYATEIGVAGFYQNNKTGSAEQVGQINERIIQKIAETTGAEFWTVEDTRRYLQADITKEAELMTANFMGYYKGHSFQGASGGAGFLAQSMYPELQEEKATDELSTVLAFADNDPPFELLEDVRSVMRLQDDVERADDGDYKFIKQQFREARKALEKYNWYFEAIDTAEVRHAKDLEFIKPINDKVMVVEGILLARKLIKIVDVLLTQPSY